MVEVVSRSETSSSSSAAEKYKEFEFPLSSSSSYSADNINSQLDHQNSADELFFQGKLLPLFDIPPTLHLNKLIFTHQNFIIPMINTDDCSIIPSTDPSIPPPESHPVGYNLDDLENDSFYEWSKEARGFTHHRQQPPQQFTKKRPNNWPQRLFYKLKPTRAYLRCLFFTKSETNCTSRMDNSDISNKEKLSILFEKKAAGYKINKKIKRISLRDLFYESHRKSFSGVRAGAIQHDRRRQCSGAPHVCLSSSTSLSSAPSFLSSSSSSSNDDFQTMLRRSRSADPELERESSIRDAIAHCKLSIN